MKDNIIWPIIIPLGALIIVVIILVIAFKSGFLRKAKIWSKWFGLELEGGNRKITLDNNKNPNWIIGPDEGKYDFSTGFLRHIPDPETLETLGFDRKKFVRWDKKQFDSKSEGHSIESVKTAKLIRKGQTSGVYAIIDGQKRWVPNPPTLEAIKRNFDDVISLCEEEFNKIPQGNSLTEVSKWSKKD